MVIVTDRNLALRCPSCGRVTESQISLFSFSGRKTLRVACACGVELFVVSTRDHRSYSLQLPCADCEENHALQLSHQEMWRADLVTLYCPHTDSELGYLGRDEAVRDAVQRRKLPFPEILSDAEYQDYFESPEIMWEALTRLQELSGRGGLGCQCGNTDIEIDIFPDKVELHCKRCDGLMLIFCQTEDDAELIRKADSVQLVRASLTSLDGRRFRRRHGRG